MNETRREEAQDAGRHIYRALTGRAPSREQEATAAELARTVEGAWLLPNAARSARLVGVSPSTWRSWREGRSQPKPDNLARLRGAVRWARTDYRTEADLRHGQPSIRITGQISVNHDRKYRRQRTIDPGKYAEPGQLADMYRAFLAGDDERAGAELLALVTSPAYVPGMTLDEISSIEIR